MSDLVPDAQVLVKPGEKVPADDVTVKGESSLNEAILTGESKPVHRTEGQKVIGGSVTLSAMEVCTAGFITSSPGDRPTSLPV